MEACLFWLHNVAGKLNSSGIFFEVSNGKKGEGLNVSLSRHIISVRQLQSLVCFLLYLIVHLVVVHVFIFSGARINICNRLLLQVSSRFDQV